MAIHGKATVLAMARIGTFRQRIAVIVTLFLTIVLALYLLPRPRTFAIQAETQGLTIEFGGTIVSAWRMPESEVCVHRSAPVAAPAGGASSHCDARLFSSKKMGAEEIVWTNGTVIQIIRMESDSDLELLVKATGERVPQFGGEPLSTGSLIFVSAQAWRSSATLIFSGRILLGAVPSPGERGIVLSGSYEIRETPRLLSAPITLRKGGLFTGDSVDVVTYTKPCPDVDKGKVERLGCQDVTEPTEGRQDEPERLNVYGFLAPRPNKDDAGLIAAVFSPTEQALMRIDRLGAEPTLIAPTWIDRVVNNPLALAVPTLLGLLGYVFAMVFFFFPEKE